MQPQNSANEPPNMSLMASMFGQDTASLEQCQSYIKSKIIQLINKICISKA